MNIKKIDRHLLIMVLCCLVVVAAILILPRFINLGILGWIIIFSLCPLSHIVMMKFMPKDGSESCHGNASDKQVKEGEGK